MCCIASVLCEIKSDIAAAAVTVGGFTCRSWQMDDKLTFDNLYEQLERFSTTGDINKKFAESISALVTSGWCIFI